MPMSEYERRAWRELEARLAREPRLVRLARRLRWFGGMPRRTTLVWAVGGGLGLVLVGVGSAVHSSAMTAAGVAVIAGTLVVVGVALVVIGLTG
jgi:Flp pilus assembly protein TadB